MSKNDKRFNDDLRTIVNMFKGNAQGNDKIIAKPVGKLIGSYVNNKIRREVGKSLYAI